MKKKELKELKVESFITSIDTPVSETIKGGIATEEPRATENTCMTKFWSMLCW